LTLENVLAAISDLDSPHLLVKLKFKDSIPNILTALMATPLKPKIAAATQKVAIKSGAVAADVQLAIDLTAKVIAPKISGQVDLDKVAIETAEPPLKISNMTGRLRIRPELVETEKVTLDLNGEPTVLRLSHDDRVHPAKSVIALDTRISTK